MNAPRCSLCGSIASGAAVTSDSDFSMAPHSPRHLSLLTSNQVPLESETHFVKSAVSTIDVRLAQLDDKIQRLRDLLAPLEAERASVSDYRAQNVSIISSLRRIPTEILGQIFVWTLPTANVAVQTYSLNDCPWLLTRICSRWRSISISIPSLWSLIAISYRRPLVPYPFEMVRTHLLRAHKTLVVYFFGNETVDSASQTEIFKLLCEHSPRWESIFLGLTSRLIPLLPALEERVGALTKLQIAWDTRDSSANVESVDCFQSAPLLTVSIYNGHRYVPTLFSTDQLTRYDLDATWQTHMDILKKTKHLVEARIFIKFFWSVPDTDEIIHLPHLLRLYVSHPEFLDRLTAPALQEIALELTEHEFPRVFDPLASFILRSSCAPHRLCVKGWPHFGLIHAVLQQHRRFTTLVVVMQDAVAFEACNSFLSQLMAPGPVAPQLSEILVVCAESASIDYSLYLRMLQTRWNGGAGSLKSAALIMASLPSLAGPGPEADILSGIETLRGEGLRHLFLDGSDAIGVADRWTYQDTGVDAPHPAITAGLELEN